MPLSEGGRVRVLFNLTQMTNARMSDNNGDAHRSPKVTGWFDQA